MSSRPAAHSEQEGDNRPSGTFADFNLSPAMMQAVNALGYSAPTPIQAQAIPIIMSGSDLLGQAQTGTGKTAAFAVPTIESLDLTRRQLQVLVLCPTRELAVQVADAYKQLLAFKPGAHVVSVYGGQPINVQYQALRRNPMVMVATPGRLLDHLDRGSVSLKTVTTVVLDEADEMLNMGFRDDIEKILKRAPEERQTLLFSATMPRQILELTRYYLTNPQRITIAPNTKALETIQQSYVDVPHRQKNSALVAMVEQYSLKSALVFCNTKHMVDDLVELLNDAGYRAEGLHGGKVQRQRERILNRFRAGQIQLLVATDVAARGIDVTGIEAVINYDLPKTDESYTHRIGRTGRAGQHGRAITLVSNHEFRSFRMLERSLRRTMDREELPADLPPVVRIEKPMDDFRGPDMSNEWSDSVSSSSRSYDRPPSSRPSYGGGGGGRVPSQGGGGYGGGRGGSAPRSRSGGGGYGSGGSNSSSGSSFGGPRRSSSPSFGGGSGGGFSDAPAAAPKPAAKGHVKKPFGKKPAPKPRPMGDY